ncbi:MAG TPA: hypothetical protein VMS98_09320 [Thermoanaerobaculia bacterium]|nr:hypothetical protein [Thermoanaerobaculia bacterium]
MEESNRTTGTPGEGEGGEEESTSGRFGRAREYASSTYSNMREKVDDVDFGAVADRIRTYVRSNPGKALLVSVGVGFAIGLLLRSGDDEE